MTPENRDSRQIEDEISQTRGDMDRTLDELQARFSPEQLMHQGLDYLRSGHGTEFVHNLNESIRRNPVPATLMGVSLAWLMLSGREGRYSPHHAQPSQFGQRMRAARDSAGAKLQMARQQVSHSAQAGRERIGSAVSSARQRAGSAQGTASQVRGRLSQGTGRVREAGYHARSNASRMVDEQPLVLGAVGIALGAALGAMFPTSRREDELMGEQRDRLMAQAREQGEAQLEKAEHVAEAASEAASEAAKQEAERQQHQPRPGL